MGDRPPVPKEAMGPETNAYIAALEAELEQASRAIEAGVSLSSAVYALSIVADATPDTQALWRLIARAQDAWTAALKPADDQRGGSDG